jgi:hypothetical protein
MAAASTIPVSTVIADVRRQFGDLDSVEMQDRDIIAWINQSQRRLVSDNLIVDTTAISTTVPNQNNYPAPVNMYQPRNVMVGNQILTALSFEEAMARYGPTLDSVGNPGVYYVWDKIIYLYPIPSTALPLKIFYAAAPMNVAVASDLLGIPDRYYELLLKLVLAKAAEMDEQTDMMVAHQNMYEQQHQRLKNAETMTDGPFHVVMDVHYDDVTY